ncbi:hypothetical protein GPECTOR_61g820 [Gonium pectorale]|uniref:Protein kinase domain-containing protein n=1 Tax=Gonium pectorale TaxID=33097 RepID=A0A150G4T9_GONPE|nr:hypothetical protein GPECTOR_61g820 [Gonium pectorale]|eukprot:KXZ44867.1 hypothetical protein GPECTOR_61g820 [Gonium pectorale]
MGPFDISSLLNVQLRDASDELSDALERTGTILRLYAAAGFKPAPKPSATAVAAHTDTSASACSSAYCGLAPASSPSSSDGSASSSSPTTSAPTSRQSSAQCLFTSCQQTGSGSPSGPLQHQLREAEAALLAERLTAAALAEQLPLIRALGASGPATCTAAANRCCSQPSASAPPPPPSDRLVLTAAGCPAGTPAGHVSRLGQGLLDAALAGQPPMDIPQLNPLAPRTDCARLLKAAHWQPPTCLASLQPGAEQLRPGTASVWKLADEQGLDYIVKVEPCHSDRELASRRAGNKPQATGSGMLVRPRSIAQAASEAITAARINDQCAAMGSPSAPPPVLPPLSTFVRPCSQLGSVLDAGYDKEVVVVFPYVERGDTRQWVSSLAALFARSAAAGCSSLRASSRMLAEELHAKVSDFGAAVEALHNSGWVHGDLKPENAVVLPDRLVLIDVAGAASVRGTWDGFLPGSGTYTPCYAPPEQGDEDAPRRGRPSDVFSFGASVKTMLQDAAGSFGWAAGEQWLQDQEKRSMQYLSPRALRSGARNAAWKARKAVEAAAERLGLPALAAACMAPNPAARPTMGQLRAWLCGC